MGERKKYLTMHVGQTSNGIAIKMCLEGQCVKEYLIEILKDLSDAQLFEAYAMFEFLGARFLVKHEQLNAELAEFHANRIRKLLGLEKIAAITKARKIASVVSFGKSLVLACFRD